MKITKLLALILAVVLSLGALTSCDAIYSFTADKLIAQADKKLTEGPYKIDLEMAFSSKNSEVNEAFSMFNDADLEAWYDGANVAMFMDIDTEIMGEDVGISMEYRIVDKMAYAVASVEVQGLSQTVKQKAELSDDELEEFKDQNSGSGGVHYEDFEKSALEMADGKFIITCTEITEDGAEKLKELIEYQLGEAAKDVDLEVSDVEVVCTLKGLQYESVKISCKFIITIAGVSTTVSYVAENNYEYGDDYKVEEPKNSQGYLEVDYDDLLSDF